MVARESIVASLDQIGVSLDTTDPEAPLSDLHELGDILSDRSVIGLGEATHGTREFFRFKHRLIRFLVEEFDLRAIAFESNFAETLRINDYVLEGKGDPCVALDGIYFWTWYTEEVLALLEWLRRFNADRPRSDRVRFYGIDAQYTAGAVAELERIVEAVSPSVVSEFEPLFREADDAGRPAHMDDDAADRVEAASRLANELEPYLATHDDRIVDTVGAERMAVAEQCLRTISQTAERNRAVVGGDLTASMAVRDEAMADNVDWIRRHESLDRIAVWAHNGHVNRLEMRSRGKTAPSMGAHLGERYGDGYYALGLEFGRGTFQALNGSKPDGEHSTTNLEECALASPLPKTIGRAFRQLDSSALLIDVGTAREHPRLAEWCRSSHGIHSIGAIYFADEPTYHVQRYELGAAFDGIVYVDETTRARPLPPSAPAE